MNTHAQTDTRGDSTHPRKTERRGNLLLGVGLALVFASAAFFSGLSIGSGVAHTDAANEANIFSFWKNDAPASEVDLGEFWRVWHLMDDKFVFSSSTAAISDEDRIYGAIKGMVESYGDPYTVFLEPQEASQFEEDISGNFGGVGMEVGMRDGLVTVVAPLPDTPAEKAGMVAGDVVLEIDGVSTDSMSVDEAVDRIRGEVGTDVVLTIYREGEFEFKEITITRGNITIPTVETETAGDVFIIKLYSFNAISEMKMQEALRSYIQSGKHKLVLDLRGNPGGFLQSAVAIGSYFLPTGKVVVREHFGGDTDDQVYRSQGKVVDEFSPENFVVLFDGGSASASEILAGALKEHGVATAIGDTSFGKGSVQELVSLGDASLKVTVARWLTPNGNSLSDGGLEPDITIKRTPQQVVAGEDPQQEAALRWLSGKRDLQEYFASQETVAE
ncbi:S41 family peptidase [Candidatus Kaiserbacteria bacterium]|nr:S41 family peptidase [Candidatus Kaiserbacteria bacterium]MCB9811793.1 S41 family peptidase [Candidatus Nomurabacteria bacterium]